MEESLLPGAIAVNFIEIIATNQVELLQPQEHAGRQPGGVTKRDVGGTLFVL